MSITEESAAVTVDPVENPTAGRRRIEGDRLHHRAARGVTEPHNWIQLIKFGLVGVSGYAINLVVYELARQQAGIHYLIAAVMAFVVAVLNNFYWNRHWTFKAGDGHAGFQAARFFVVSLIALGVNLILLKVLVAAGVGEFPAQAIAVICVTPVNFIGNKLWSFRGHGHPSA
jgi:dolichol-phosphate mannosyltransferase